MARTSTLAGWLACPAFAVSLAAGMDVSRAQEAGAALSPPALMVNPDDPGPVDPPLGRSLFDVLYEQGPPAASRANARYDIPYPFEALLADLNRRTAPRNVRTALIPLGRSLQRYAAHPDYFASPRLVAAVDAETAEPYLKDRLYIGYQPSAEAIEVISYNEQAGRFEFQEITGYTAPGAAAVHYSERAVCAACHQAHAPIFATALWSESNGNRAVAERLAGLGDSYHGAPVRQGVDGPDFFDQSTDRANELLAAGWLWDRGCAAADDPRACRAGLLLAALRYRLGGARGPVATDAPDALTALWPDGLWAASADVPNRDPLALIEAGAEPGDVVEPAGLFDPTTPRAPVALWQPGTPPALLIAALFSDADIAWLDERLARLAPMKEVENRTPCPVRPAGTGEWRFACESGALALDGYFKMAEGTITGGRLRSLRIRGHAPLNRLTISPGSAIGSGPWRLGLRETSAGLHARLPGGERLSRLSLDVQDSGAGMARISVLDDIAYLEDAITNIGDPLAGGPPLRRAILSAIDQALP